MLPHLGGVGACHTTDSCPTHSQLSRPMSWWQHTSVECGRSCHKYERVAHTTWKNPNAWMWVCVSVGNRQSCIMRATWHQLRTQARGSSAHVEAKMNQIGPPSAAQGKHVEDWLQTSIGKSRSGRFAAEWWTSMLKTSNTQMVNSGNRQTPAAKDLLLLAFRAQAMLSAISRVCRNVQHLHENKVFYISTWFS